MPDRLASSERSQQWWVVHGSSSAVPDTPSLDREWVPVRGDSRWGLRAARAGAPADRSSKVFEIDGRSAGRERVALGIRARLRAKQGVRARAVADAAVVIVGGGGRPGAMRVVGGGHPGGMA